MVKLTLNFLLLVVRSFDHNNEIIMQSVAIKLTLAALLGPKTARKVRIIMLIMGVLLIKTQLLLLLSELLVTLKLFFNRITNAKAEMNISILPYKFLFYLFIGIFILLSRESAVRCTSSLRSCRPSVYHTEMGNSVKCLLRLLLTVSLMLNVKQGSCEKHFFKSLVGPDSESNPRSTNPEADALSTQPSDLIGHQIAYNGNNIAFI